jgi:hypothetical protein
LTQISTLQFKQKLSHDVAARLDDVADGEIVQALAYRIRACNRNENLFTADGLQDVATGNRYHARGSLWSCSSRFCSHCVGKLSRRAAKIADYVYQNERKIIFCEWRFIVLTMPDNALAGLPLAAHHEIFYHAWRHLYTKSKFWKKKVRGAIKTEEFTLKPDRENPYHFHGNVLAYGYFPDHEILKKEWTKALKISFARHGLEWHCPTKNDLPNVQIKLVVRRRVRDDKKEISREGAIFELCKYVTKPQDWQNIPAEHLEEVARTPRFFRAFELVGSCKETAKAIRPNKRENALREAENAECENAEILTNLNKDTYLDKKLITVPKNLFDSEICNNSPPKLRKKSWFSRIKNKEITLEQYKAELDGEISNVQKFRKLQLRLKFGFVPTFFTLDGECF